MSKGGSADFVVDGEDLLVTCSGPVNMAVIKYWGKRDSGLILPLNSSLSTTLNQDDLKTVTTILASKKLKEDELWLNGKKESLNNERVPNVLKAIKERADRSRNWSEYHLRIVSYNNFPTAAGLASSASGYCCLVFTLAQVYGVKGEISTIARMGSGSACRSMYGGFVAWEMGSLADGTDSKAVQYEDENHWPELQILILVVNDQKKETSSTGGMETSVKTSQLLQERVKNVVPERMKQMQKAIHERDFQTFAKLTMLDSDSFHAVCADTKPPIYYLNQTSKKVIELVNHFNKFSGTLKAAYTFDAGPNAVLYTLKEDLPTLLSLALYAFPPKSVSIERFFKKHQILKEAQKVKLDSQLTKDISVSSDALKYILHTTVGKGPQILSKEESLIDLSTGLPKYNLQFEAEPILVDLNSHGKYWGVVLNTLWPFPSFAQSQYESFSQLVQELDPAKIYVYPFSALHITIATPLNFKTGANKLDVGHRAEYIEKWRKVILLASTYSEWPSRPFQIQINQPIVEAKAAFFQVTPKEPFMAIRSCIRKAVSESKAEQAGLRAEELFIPDIVHSTFLRFKDVPTNPTAFQIEFNRLASSWKPITAEIFDLNLVIEDTPFMHLKKDQPNLPLILKFGKRTHST